MKKSSNRTKNNETQSSCRRLLIPEDAKERYGEVVEAMLELVAEAAPRLPSKMGQTSWEWDLSVTNDPVTPMGWLIRRQPKGQLLLRVVGWTRLCDVRPPELALAFPESHDEATITIERCRSSELSIAPLFPLVCAATAVCRELVEEFEHEPDN